MSFIYQHVQVDRIVDGDTVVLTIDMGNKITWRDSFRLYGIDTPERGQAGYKEATEYLRSLLAAGLARIETFKPDKYGRWLADLFIATDGGELNVNRLMIVEGHAREYFGGAKQ